MESDHVGAPTRTRRGSLSFLGRVLINAQIESATSGRDGGVREKLAVGVNGGLSYCCVELFS